MNVYPYFLKPATSLCRFPAFHSILWSRVALLFVVVSSVSLTFVSHAYAAPSPVPPLNTFTFYQNPGTYNYVIPPGVTSITVEVWGGGGRGGSRTTGTAGTGGGGGGAYSRRTVAVTPGQIYVVNVGVGSTSNTTPGGDTWVSPNTVGNALVLAKGGNSAANNVTTGATGGAAGSGIGDVRFSGGNGANAPSTTSSGGGGSSAGISANGTNASGTTGGVAPLNGGNGANGRTTAGSGTAGSLPGGGGSGAVRGTTGSPAGGAGAHGKVQINLTFDVNAGPDQTQCNNAMFQVSTNPPLAGYSFSWSVVSGTGFIYDNWSTNTQITVPAGSSATVRLSVTDGTTTITDDVVLTNTTSCTPSCVNPVNINGDLEQQGTANAYNLSFQGTPASVIFQNSNPVGWAERYGTATPNTTSFTGAYYLNKTGVNGDPHSGSKFIYMAGEGICLSNLKTWQNISCGKTYRVSVWVAAYSNSGTQSSSPFAIEFNGGGPNVPSFAIAETLRAPASASWNNLNWQRYSFEFTIPSTGYEWGDFLFTTFDNVNGIVIDDMCVEEVFNGAHADAGPDQYKCDNSFTMSANTPASGFTGSWSVVSGSASVSNVSSPTSPVTLTSGNAARLRWTMTRSGTNTFYAINPEKEGGFESCCSPYDNGWTEVNNATNKWVVGTGGGSTGGSQAAYISNNGGTSAAYNITTAQTSHLYRDVTIHPNASGINLQFDWQNMGESGFDRLLVYTAPTTLDPAAGTPASSSTTLTGATLVSTLNLHSRQHFTNELISLPASLAGTTFRLIFTWQNNNTGGTNWLAAVVDNVSLSYTLTSCNDFDEVTIVNNTANTGLTVNNANICPGTSATLTATGCNAGNLLWSNGATSNSITVFPATTSTYSVTCTPVPSANLLTNGNFESATNLQGWTNWDNASITTNPADVYAGSKAVFLNGSVSYAGVAQGFATTPGQRFRVRFYAKTTNSNALPLVRYHVYDNISNTLDDGEGVHITSTNYQLYEFFVTTPPNTTWVTFFAETSDKGGLYVDDFEVVSINGCTSTALSTVTVGETNVVQNPEFNSGTTSWELYAQGGAAATLNHDNTSQLSGVNSARINISTATGTDWHVQFVENGLTLEAGKTYTLSFRARAAAARVINASVDLGQDPWTNYLYQNVNVTTTGQLFTYTFTQPAGTSNGRVVFNLGQSNQTVWIDDVKLFEACSAICDPNNSNAPPFCAPSPICNSSNTINWSQSINSTNGNPGLVRFVACGGTVTYTLPISLPAEFNGPVSVNITDAVSWDGYSGRNTVSQSNESWRVLFRKNGSTVYASPFTNDVPDNVNQGYWRGSLGSATFLPNGADQIIIEHWGVSNNNTACNSVIPASVCISYAVCTPPAAPTTTSASRCGPGTVTLTAAGCSGGTLRWYTASSGGSSIGTGASFTTPSISSTTTYFVACESGGCESTTRTAAVATVNNVNAFVSGILNLCPSNNTTTLTGNGGGTYVWSTGATTSSITVSPVSTTTYTLTVTNGGCSTAVTATVNVGLSCCAGHVTSNIIAEYNFSEGTGSVVNDVSGFGTPLNLTIQNPANTTWVTGCGLRINSSTRIASTGNATKIRTALQATNAMTVEAWVQAANTTQNGPARIVSMSTNTSERNFTLGQGTSGGPGTVWAFRTRQSGTNDWNGMPERTTTANSATTNLTHLVFTRDAAGVERFYINGVQNATWTQTGNFSNWSDYVLNLGNEQTNDRPWLGTLYNVIIYSNALSAAEVTQNFSAGSKGDCSNCPPPDCITQLCAPLSCPSGNCYTNNLIVNPDFETNVNNWIASNGQVSQGGGGRYGNFIQVNVSDLAGTYTAYQDVNFGAGQGYRFEGNVAKHGVNNNVKVYLEFYNGSTYLSKTADFNVTMNFDGWNWENFGFQGLTPANTTKIRIVAWCNGNAIKMDKVSLIGCTNITSSANANNVCVGGTINLTSAINLNNVNPVKQLVSNGGFVSGSVTGFSTDVPSGSFGFTTNPQNANGSWVWGTDNTTGTGNLMWFSDDNAASNRRQWFNTYTVVPNTTYTLSFWVRNVWSGGSNPTLFWTVNGTQVGSTITPAFGSNWVQLSTTWNSGSNTSATFAVVLQTNSWNFDFALDDISITGTETTYLWSGPNSYSSSLQNNNLTNAISSMAGTYAVITSAGNGCTASSNVNVVVNSNNTVTTNATRTLCVNTALSPTISHTTTGATGIGTVTGLPTGVTAAWAGNTITISGTPTASGTFNYTIPLTGGCGAVNATGTITVTANNTVTTNATRTLCINTALSPTITHTTTGATGIGTTTGLPTGVTAAWAGNTITISGTPTASGTFNYTIPLTGGCGAVNATGTITVTANNTATTNATRTLCVNTALSPTITHTTTGATGIGTATGLPAGVTAVWASNTITISGTPTASGTFNYTIPLTGGCGAVNATGTITVTANNTVTGIGSATTCINTAISTITHTTTGATGIGTVTGLPTGVTAAWASNTITISGTPTASGTFNYTIPLTGGCGAVNATGTITVTANNTVTTNATRTLCINTALSPTITHTTTGATGIGTATDLPAGVTATWASNTITISGTPTVSGTFNYTIPLTGGCGVVNAIGTITVNAINTVTSNATRTLCINTALSPTITHTTTGATGIGTATGLPAGVTATWASNTITISGTPTASGTFNYTIPLTGGCGNINATGTITVTANNTVTTNASRTLCINTALSPTITHTTTGATGIGTATGLPSGVTASWASNTITISGTPTASGTFNYTIPLTGGCGAINATGTITVTPNNTVTGIGSATTCINTAITTITHTTTGATGIGIATGLPTGVTAAWASNTISISGTPTASGTFNYTIPLTGGCGTVNATGTITVTANNTVTTNATRTLCVNTALSPTITHTTTGATGIGTATGLPAGVTAAWASNTITISGTPTASGTFNYTIPLTGGCGAINATGTITVTPNNTVTGIGSATTCINTAITTITHTTTGATGIGTATGLPAGVTATWASNTITISGTPTASGTFNYTIPLTGGCGAVNAIGTITVNANPTAPVVGTITQPTCTTPTGSVVLSGLPATGSWTISRAPGGTTYNGTGTSFTVTGLPVNTTFTFTVTNSNTCTSPASANVAINPIPSNPTLGGASAVCIGLTANVTPATAGTWTSSNNSVASITNAGLVTGVTAGSVTLTYTRTSDGCSNTRPFTVNTNPTAPVVGTIIQPTCSTPAGSVVLNGLPSTGSWTITRTPGGVTYTGTGTSYTVNNLPSDNSYTFTVTNNNSCVSLSSTSVGIDGIPSIPTLGGDDVVCVGGTAIVTPTTSGTWLSSNTSVATITNEGVVTGIAPGMVVLTYTRNSNGCSGTREFTVYANPIAPVVGAITQPTCTTPTGSVVLSGLPSTGSWTITRTPGGTTYTGTGTNFTVTGLPINSTYTFMVTNSNICSSPPSANVAIIGIPGLPVTGGSSSVCKGSIANVTPSSNGTWTSSNTNIATVTNTGIVTGITTGTVSLTYTRTSDGCSNSLSFTVNPVPNASIVANITQSFCITCPEPQAACTPPTTWDHDKLINGTVSWSSLNIGDPSNITQKIKLSGSGKVVVMNNNVLLTSSNGVLFIEGIEFIVDNGNLALTESGARFILHNGSLKTFGNFEQVSNSGICIRNSEIEIGDEMDGVVFNSGGNPSSTASWINDGGYRYLFNNRINVTHNFQLTSTGSGTGINGVDVICNSCMEIGDQGENNALDTDFGIADNNDSGNWDNNNRQFIVNSKIGIANGNFQTSNNTISVCNLSVKVNKSGSFIVNSGIFEGNHINVGVEDLFENNGNWTATGITWYSEINNTTNVPGAGSESTKNNILAQYLTPCGNNYSIICSGQSTTLTAHGGTSYLWSTGSTNPSITVNPTVNTLYTVTVSDSQGCTAIASQNIITLSNPTAPIVGTITQPTCTTPTGSVVLSGLPSTGSWTIIRTPGGTTYTGTGTSFTVTGLPVNTTYNFTITNQNNCTSLSSADVSINQVPGSPVINGASAVCTGSSVNISPASGGTWTSSNTSVATITNAGLVTGVAAGSVTLTYTRTIDGCSNTRPFTVNANPLAPVGTITQPTCTNPTGSVILNGLPATGNYTINQSPGGIPYNASGSTFTISGLSPNTNYTFTVTSAQNCTSPSSATVNIAGIPSSPSVQINFNGSVCFETNKQLSALVSGGVGPFSYSWTGPSGFTANTQNVQIPVNGNYFVTVTDVNLCTAVTSGFVYQRYEPFVVSLQTRVCEGQNVTLDVNSPSAVSYLWGSNAGNNTTKMVTVTPQVPSSTYLVTVTNDLGCTAVPQITIQVDPRPIVSITGSNIICQEQTTQLSPSTGGTWVSTNPGVATINNSGLVTGISAGTATFVFTSSTTNCASHPSAPVTVHAKPVVVVTGPNPICIGQTTTLSPSTGGTWTSSNVSVATVNNSGIVTGISNGSATFTYTNTSTSCVSNASTAVIFQNIPSATITGNGSVCESSNIILNASVPGGTWTSSNHAVAVINNSGIVSGISPGIVTITYQYGTGVCSGQVQKSIEVLDKPVISYTGDQTICVGQTTSLSSGQSGNWTSSNPMIAIISQSGVVTGVSGGVATFTFENLATGCLSDASEVLTVYEKPTVSLTGPSTICLGRTTQVTPSSGGVWTSSNPLVATITNNGVITSTGIGTTSFTFTDNLTGCSSDGNISVSVGAAISAMMDYHGNICLTDTSKLSVIPSGGTPAFSYQWVGPLGFTGNTQIIDINANGNYFVTITDALGCKANLSGFVYQRFDPFIVNLSSSVCEGQSVNLSVNAPTAVSYLWSSNASNAVTSSVQVIPVLPSSAYFVTVTNNLGCKAVANASVLVNPKPVVNITGGNTICIGQTTTMTPSSGGSWVALHPSVATITQAGVVTGTGFGNARFLFTNSTTGCTSDTSGIVSVNSSTNIAFVGPSSVCAGDQTSVSPGSGGSWVSSNTSVATVNNAGLVVALSPGVAQLTYTNNLGCTTNGSLSVTVHDKPAILLDGPSQICIGSTTRFLPSNGGTWTTSHASIASINNSGLVTGISQGTARFVYTNAFTGCKSDSSTTINILPRPVVQITGNNPICVGSSTTLSPNTGGMWMSSNPSVASVTNAGVVNGLGQGNVNFTFTNNTTGCSSLPTAPLTVNARPVVSVTGPNGICIGGTTTLSPSTGGTWTVVNPSVASVSNAGLVTGLAPGSTGFIFTNASTGCISNATNNVTVYGRPTVNINSTSICVGATTTVTPSTGGVWTSSNPAVATVNGSGLVTGVSAGQVSFTFTENSTGCTSNPTSTLQVFGKPVVSITGPTNICVGQTTTLQPITGGAWSSLSPSVATVSNSGIVTGVGNGSAQFVFTSNQGCASDPSGNVTVNARPVVIITGLNPICIGTTTQLSPASGGTWVSSHPSVASVNNSGLVTGMAAGGSRFVFTQTSTGCSSDSSSLITVNAPPVVNLLGSPSICIGQTSQVSPTAGGTWMSLNPTIATVSNVGLVTGVSAGQASFKFVQTSTGCENTLSNVITVRPRPDISLSGPSQICIGATTQFTPTSGGTWTSLMTSVATINNSGLVTGISQGQATFRFTSASTGCTSLASAPVTVLGRPTVLLDGPNSICIGNNTQVLPNSGGSWSSTNPLVATVSLTGLVTGVGAGTAQFIFTEENTGCVSNPTTAITVFNGATVSLSGPSSICTGYNSTLSSSTSGVWYSTNPMIAEVSSNGMVTGIAPGKVSFYFQQSGTGCLSYLPDDILTVTQCIDADFNVTAVNVPLTGDVHTNDEVPVGTTYSTNPYLVGKPDGSSATLTMLNNGKYTFTADKPGTYLYNVPVCIPGMGSSCPVSALIITVVNPFTQSHNLITNLDITYTIQDQPVNFNAQVNDDCISASGCMVDPQMITVIVPPNHGNAIILTDGSLLYTPASGFIGFDTLTYQVCATNNAGNCRSAQLIVTVMSSDASNSLAAADDFYSIPKGGVVSDANVLFNDFDPEGGKISIIPQGSVQNPVVLVAGSYHINSEGVLHFEASPTFTGPFDIVYTICDSVNFCVNATAHILVVDNMKLRIRAYLEGALMENKDAVSSTGRPLMRDDLRNNKFTNSNIIPSIDPYSNPVGFIDISHRFDHVGSSGSAALTTIQHPNTVFAVTGENAIVDWVFIELRSKENYGEVIGTRSALIQRDGDVVDLDGVSFVEFPGLNVDSCYVVLKHRNHLGVMSLKIATGDLVDFTSPSTPVFDYGTGKNDGYDYTGLAQKADVALGYMSLWAGDFDGSGKIKFVNPDDDQNFLFIEVLFYPTNTDFVANYNFVHGYLQGDYDLNGKSKYDNPDDDKNMLFYQVLFYPLNTNYTSNFNFITEQVPPKNIN